LGKIKDITGQKFGRLTVIKMITDKRLNGYIPCECRCDCGNVIIVQSGHLRSGHTNSCGCYKSDRTIEAHKTIAYDYPRLYRIWCKMKERCNNKKCKGYKDYGGRGIKIYDEWNGSFESFCKWALENGYEDNLSIERIDVNGNYEPSNCTWIPLNQQQRNRRNCFYIEDVDGRNIILEDFANKYDIGRATIRYRYLQGDRGQRLIRPTGVNKSKYKNEW